LHEFKSSPNFGAHLEGLARDESPVSRFEAAVHAIRQRGFGRARANAARGSRTGKGSLDARASLNAAPLSTLQRSYYKVVTLLVRAGAVLDVPWFADDEDRRRGAAKMRDYEG
jgi:hypothetical protein